MFRIILFLILILLSAFPAQAAGPYDVRLPAPGLTIDRNATTVVGRTQEYTLKKGDDLLEIARKYGLGYMELGNIYRDWDPFIPPPGARIVIPTIWIVPSHPRTQIVVNTGEMRMYYFIDNNTKVITYPIGMGVLDFKTPNRQIHRGREKSQSSLAYSHLPAGQIRHGSHAVRSG